MPTAQQEPANQETTEEPTQSHPLPTNQVTSGDGEIPPAQIYVYHPEAPTQYPAAQAQDAMVHQIKFPMIPDSQQQSAAESSPEQQAFEQQIPDMRILSSSEKSPSQSPAQRYTTDYSRFPVILSEAQQQPPVAPPPPQPASTFEAPTFSAEDQTGPLPTPLSLAQRFAVTPVEATTEEPVSQRSSALAQLQGQTPPPSPQRSRPGQDASPADNRIPVFYTDQDSLAEQGPPPRFAIWSKFAEQESSPAVETLAQEEPSQAEGYAPSLADNRIPIFYTDQDSLAEQRPPPRFAIRSPFDQQESSESYPQAPPQATSPLQGKSPQPSPQRSRSGQSDPSAAPITKRSSVLAEAIKNKISQLSGQVSPSSPGHSQSGQLDGDAAPPSRRSSAQVQGEREAEAPTSTAETTDDAAAAPEQKLSAASQGPTDVQEELTPESEPAATEDPGDSADTIQSPARDSQQVPSEANDVQSDAPEATQSPDIAHHDSQPQIANEDDSLNVTHEDNQSPALDDLQNVPQEDNQSPPLDETDTDKQPQDLQSPLDNNQSQTMNITNDDAEMIAANDNQPQDLDASGADRQSQDLTATDEVPADETESEQTQAEASPPAADAQEENEVNPAPD